MPDVTINYKGKSESAVAAARRVALANEKAAKESEAAFVASGKKIGTSFSAVGSGGGLKGLAGGVSAIGGSAVGVGAALAGVAVGLTSVVNAARDQARATRLTQAVLTSTGGAANVTAKQVEDLAGSLSRASGVQDEVVQAGENVLLTFTSVRNEIGKGNDVFTQATKASLDMSAALGGDLQSNIIRVGKALQDPVGGLTALRRVGVNVDELSGKVKKLVADGDKLGAQKAIIHELGTEFGGAAAAAADPFSKLNVAVDELKESFGREVIPQVTQFVSLLAKGANLVSKLGPKDSSSGGGVNLNSLSTNPLEGITKAQRTFLTRGPLGLFNLFGEEKKAKAALNEYDAAVKQVNRDVAAGASKSVIKEDGLRLTNAIRVLSGAPPVLDKTADAASKAAAAFDKLTAAADAGAQAASQTVTLKIGVDTAGTNFRDAVSALHDNGTDSSGGGSTETAASKFFDQASKQTAVRDANLAVSRSGQGVTDAQHALATAEEGVTTAAKSVADAQKNYNTILHGVAAGSRAAKDAQDAYTQALDKSKSASLDLIDAQRNLQDAKEAAANAGHEAQQGATGAGIGLQSAQLDVKDAQAALGRARESEDPETIQRAQIALSEAQLRVSEATDANTAAQKQLSEVNKKNSKENEDVKRAQIGLTEAQIAARQAAKDQTEAQRVLNGTLHGFSSDSKEAQQATADLKTAQDDLFNSTQSVISAQAGLVDAQNNVYDSNLALQRATADLQGKLEAVGGGAAGKKLDSFQTKLDNVTTAAQSSADSIYANIKNATGSVGQGILAEIQALQFAVAAEPLLRGAFAGEIASLYAQYNKLLLSAPLTPVTGKGGIGATGKNAGNFGVRASGGPVRAGHPYLVGEKGPELFRPNADGAIVPNHSLRNSVPFAAGAGSTTIVHVTINGDVWGVTDLNRKLDEAAARFAKNNGRALGTGRR